MKRGNLHNFKRGFTLTELMISMTLFALVAASVIMFVTAMASFSSRNEEKINRISQEAEIREKIDFWFSVMDSEGYEIEINQGNYIARATSAENQLYYIRWRYELGDDGIAYGILQFLYPTKNTIGNRDGMNLVEIEADEVRHIYFARQSEERNDSFPAYESEDKDDEFVFPIKTHVTPADYLCKIVYAE